MSLVRSKFWLFMLLCAGVGFDVGTANGAPLSAADRAFFENKIRPVLVRHCYECHAEKSKELGGKLLLDSRQGILKGGESGAALVAGDPANSLILQALRYENVEMPPREPLPAAVIADFETWIQRGAPDPRTGGAAKADQPDARQLWSLQVVASPALPAVENRLWPRDRLDYFVLAKMEASRLAPANDAAPRALFRRLSFDLLGLPPTAAELDRYLAAHQVDPQRATRAAVDEMLSRRAFAERWARHWLDVARYGESNGNDGLGRNPTFPHAWRYRDYVINALAADTPYDQFLTEQIAGDLLPSDSAQQRDRQLVATGFLSLAAKPAKAMNNNFAMDVVADQLDVVGRGVMGLSVGCARCHDHKFDPIPTRDYYALAGLFTSSETMWGLAANEGLTAPATGLHVLKAAANVPPPADFVETVLVLESNTGKPKAIPKPKWPLGTPLAMGMRDRAKPVDCKINIKGDAKKLGASVPRGFLSACATGNDGAGSVTVNPKQSGRLELAQWLANGRHPLTARVMVNRIWQHLFGEGLVRTVDDFGVYGERPSHPELLDHLAARFVEDRWSIKQLIRSIVLSRTYQLSCQSPGNSADLGNRLLTRHNRRRLDAESLRDAMLSASGQFNPQPGQGSVIRHRDILVNLAGSLHQPSPHRSIYLCYLRSSPPPELAAFDLPEFTAPTGKRATSTAPGQSLHLYNNALVLQQARALANRVISDSLDSTLR